MALPVSYALMVLRNTTDPDLAAAMIDSVAEVYDDQAGPTNSAPCVPMPPAWVLGKQKGPVGLAAWAARYCDDADTLRTIYTQPNLRRRVRHALCRSKYLPADLRAQISIDHPNDDEAAYYLRDSMSPAAFAGDFFSQSRPDSDQIESLSTRIGNAEFDDDQIGLFAWRMCELGHSQWVLELLSQFEDSTTPAAHHALHVALATLLDYYDWAPRAKKHRLNHIAAAELGVNVHTNTNRPAPSDDLIQEAISCELPYTDDEFTTIAASAIAEGYQDLALEAAATRTQVEIVLALTYPTERFSVLPRTDYPPTAWPTDPLMDELVTRLDVSAAADLIGGEWTATLGHWHGAPSVFPTAAQLESIYSRDLSKADITQLAQSAAWGIDGDSATEEYRHLLLDRVPGLLPMLLSDGSSFVHPTSRAAIAERYIWDAINATGCRLDLALDQMAANPDVALRDLRAVLTNLAKVRG